MGCVSLSGKVLDSGCRSKVCKSCDYWSKQDPNSEKYRQWNATHAQKCTMTHDGSSGGMESEVAKEVFSRSVTKHKLQYVRFIGDGDTNSFKKVIDSNPYGNSNTVVEKIECVGHVQKRMGSRLRNLKARTGTTRLLSDGKKTIRKRETNT